MELNSDNMNMKKKGFTFIEVMIAMTIFAFAILLVVKLNSASTINLNKQNYRQSMLFTAQRLMESYKSVPVSAQELAGTIIDGFYVKVDSPISYGTSGTLFEITIHIRPSATDTDNEEILSSHVIRG